MKNIIAQSSTLIISAFLVIVVNKSESAGPGMQCYIGNCTTFEDCRRPELISDCPNDKLYDACISIVVQKAYGKLTVEKKCGFSNICDTSSVSWWSDECDRKSDEDSYQCTTCCSSPMCNGARQSVDNSTTSRSLLCLAMFYQIVTILLGKTICD